MLIDNAQRMASFLVRIVEQVLPDLPPGVGALVASLVLGVLVGGLLLAFRQVMMPWCRRSPALAGRVVLVMEPILRALPPIGAIWVGSLPVASEAGHADLWAWGVMATGLVLITWMLMRLGGRIRELLGQLVEETPSPWDDLALDLAGRLLRGLVPLGALWVGVRMLADQPVLHELSDRVLGVAVVLALAWSALQAVSVADRALVPPGDLAKSDNLAARRRLTQVMVIRRIAYLIIGVFTLASLLMQFEVVRQLGTSLLASAGVASLVIGLAAQRTIANLLAGVQIALTQPIRLDDVVIVEGEWGRIEEITLTYVVVAIWDQRRLVVPISHFLEKPFQNWTRSSAEILGAVEIQVDHGLPVEELRAVVGRLVAEDPRWDGRVANVQVTGVAERSITVRVLVSARHAGDAWDLRCHLREALVSWLAQRGSGLPVLRLGGPRDLAAAMPTLSPG